MLEKLRWLFLGFDWELYVIALKALEEVNNTPSKLEKTNLPLEIPPEVISRMEDGHEEQGRVRL